MSSEVAFLGGGGLTIELYEYMHMEGVKIAGYYSPGKDSSLAGILPWLGDETVDYDENLQYMIAAGTIAVRKKMITFIDDKRLKVHSFISSKSYVSSLAKINRGVVIAPYVAITGNPIIGDFLLANIYSSIAHHAVVGDNVILGPGARVTGNCRVGSNCSMGANSSLLPSTHISDDVEVGINCYPPKRVAPNCIVYQGPGKKIAK